MVKELFGIPQTFMCIFCQARWGKVVDASCKLCSGQGQAEIRTTLVHMLKNCDNMLDMYQCSHVGFLS